MPVAEPVKHLTQWHLEKRDGSLEDFIADRRDEARGVLAGHRSYDLIDSVAFHREIGTIKEWLSDPKLNQNVKTLWTPDRIIDAALQRMFESGVSPTEVIERVGNILVTAGITALLNLLKGDVETAFSNATSYLGVGDSNNASSVGQTDLQAATNKLRKAMNATYPIDVAPTIQFQSTFGSGEANFAWNEIATFNAAAAGTMLNRVVQSLGSKTAGSAWSLTETITWS